MPKQNPVFSHKAVQAFLALLLSLYIRLVYFTSRKRLLIDPAAAACMRGETHAIFAFWHGRMMMMPILRPKRPMRVLASRHRDGKLISSVVAHFGLSIVSGSTGVDKRGQAAVAEMLRALENGENIGITPDGPRGPAQIAARGVVTVARLSGRPVLPIAFSASHAVRLKSWDRFVVALPFGRIVLCVGEPITVPEEASEHEEENARLVIENAINAETLRADEAAHG